MLDILADVMSSDSQDGRVLTLLQEVDECPMTRLSIEVPVV